MAALAAAADKLTTLRFNCEAHGVDLGPLEGLGGGSRAPVLTCE